MTTNSESRGRLFGKNVLEATFRAFHGTDLFLGELLVAEDPERVRRFLFRVVQVTYGSDSSDPGWAERTAGAYMSGDAAGTPYTLRDPEQRLHKVATCAPLGYIDPAGEFRKPKSLPAQFAKVTAPAAEDFAFLRERMGDLRIGQLRSGEDTIDLEVFPAASNQWTPAQRRDGCRLRSRHPRRHAGHPRGHLCHHRHGQVEPDEGPGGPDSRVAGTLRLPAVRPAR